MKLSSWTLAIGLGIGAGSFARGILPQERPDPGAGNDPHSHEAIEAPAALRGDDARSEMVRLFGSVETKLGSVDILLTDAAAGDTTRLSEVEEAGVDELLKHSLDLGHQLQADIERILELAEQSTCPKCGGGS